MRRLIPLLLLLAVCVAVATPLGCGGAQKKRDAEQRKKEEERTRNATVDLGVAEEAVKSVSGDVRDLMGSDKDPVRQAVYLSMQKKLITAHTGIKNAGVEVKENRSAIANANARADRAEDNRDKSLNRLYGLAIFIGGLAMAAGLGLTVTGAVNGKSSSAGIGIATIGGSVVGTFLLIKSATPIIPWVVAGLGVIVVLSFGWYVIDRFKARREKQTREDQFKQVSKAVKEVDAELPDAPVKAMIAAKVDSKTKQMMGLSVTGATVDEDPAVIAADAVATAAVDAAGEIADEATIPKP